MGKLFKLDLEKRVHKSTQTYESNDGRGTRSEDFESYSYKAYISEMYFDPEWKKVYAKKQEEVKEMLYTLQNNLFFLGVGYQEALLEVNIPTKVKAKWVEDKEKMIAISLTKEEYDILLSSTHKEEKAGRSCFHEVDIAYFYLHFGIRGEYLELFGEPGAERHKKGYLDKYIDLSQTEKASEAALFTMAKLLEKGFEGTYDWDYRYMPEFQQSSSPNQGTLGDLLKGLNL